MANPSQQILVAIKGSDAGGHRYTIAGSYSWTAPAGVTTVHIVAIGGGGGGTRVGAGGGGELRYKNTVSVTPSNVYAVVVGVGGTGATASDNLDATNGTNSTFASTVCVAVGGKQGYLDRKSVV